MDHDNRADNVEALSGELRSRTPRQDLHRSRTAALNVYQAKISGLCDWPWQEVVAKLASRFQHFEECHAHNRTDKDPENCPFCHDEDRWQRYLTFCSRQKVTAVRRDADIAQDGAASISIFELHKQHEVGQQ